MIFLGETADLHLTVSSSIILDRDVANTLIIVAEEGEEDEGFNGCDIIAMATHGRGGPPRWVMGSVTERILGATRLPMFIIRPPHVTPKREKVPATTAQKSEQPAVAIETQSWVGLL